MTIFNMFRTDLELIAKMTKLLDEHDLNGEFTYVHVELREAETHTKIGHWSDEIGPDSWYYQPIDVA